MRGSGVFAVGRWILGGLAVVLFAACGNGASTVGPGSSRTATTGAGSTTAGSTATGTSGGATSAGSTGSGTGGSSGSASHASTASVSDAGAGNAGLDAGGTDGGGSGGEAGGGTGGGAHPSAGCGASNPPVGGGYSIDVSGTMRQYVLGLPASYDTNHPYPLVLAFHGHSYSGNSVADGGPPGAPDSGPYYDIQSASNDSAIFVAPQAIGSGWSSSDLDFVNAMVDQFESDLCVDEARVFATGFSMGAIMTITIGCSEGDRFRAVAAMSGEVQGTCAGNHRVAYWASHGMSDPTIAIANGEAARDTFVSIDGCGSQTTPGSPAGCVNYQGCAPGYPVTWCPFDGVHQPPPFSGVAIWSFLSQF
jgi:hypothetical protein